MTICDFNIDYIEMEKKTNNLIIKKEPSNRKFKLSKQFASEIITPSDNEQDYQSIDLLCQVFRYWYYVTFSYELGSWSANTFLKHFAILNYRVDKKGVYNIKISEDFLVKSYRGFVDDY